jgi:hypothetical protein
MPISNTAASPKSGYELVFMIRDYIDGPRSGVANFEGKPHFFECIFNETEDEYSDQYRLTKLRSEPFKAAQENWNIFVQWREAFDSGAASRESHPALPKDGDRYEATKQLLDQAVASERSTVRVRGEFEPLGESRPPLGVLTPWQVRWSTPED